MTETFEVARVDQTTREHDDKPDEPLIHCFGYDKSGTFKHATVEGFEPYFYVAYSERPTPPEVEASEYIQRVEETKPDGSEFTAARGQQVAKVVTYVPGYVSEAREQFVDHYESDVLFPQRFITDLDVKSGIEVPTTDEPVHVSDVETVDYTAEWRVHYTDIEVDDRAGFPENGDQPILCITAYDSFANEYITWIQGEGEDADYVEESELHDATVDVRYHDDEADMLRSYFAYLRATRPAIFTAWNVEFDAEYLVDRARVLADEQNEDVGIESISPLRSVSNHDYFGVRVKGMVVFDLLDAFSATKFTELESYRLDYVAEQFVGDTKESYVGTIGDMWKEDPEALVDYNVRDVELVVEINRKQEIVPFWKEVKSIVACQLDDAITESTAADRYILSEYNGEVVFPNQGSADETGDSFSGGAVFEPIEGIRQWVSTLDLASLYPMSMLTLNASPETKVDPDVFDGETVHSPNGIYFRQDKDGLTRQLITDLLERRNKKKEQRNACDPESDEYDVYDRQQRALKVIMNCFSGDTDVLTPDGPRNIQDVEVGDEVYSINPDTGDVEIKPVVDTVEQENHYGELEHIQTQHTDLKITPNHRMLVGGDKNPTIEHFDDLARGTTHQIPRHSPMDGDGIETISLIDDVIECGGRVWIDCGDEHGRSFRARIDDRLADELVYEKNRTAFRLDNPEVLKDVGVPDACEVGVQYGPKHSTVPLEYDADDWIQLLAWLITEGSFTPIEQDLSIGEGKSYRGHTDRISISKYDGPQADEIKQLLTELGVGFSRSENNFCFSNSIIFNRLINAIGDGAENKRIPDWVFSSDLGSHQYRALLNTMIRADGDSTGPNDAWRYTTKSEQLRDDVVELAVRAGYKAQYTYAEESDVWRIYLNQNKGSFIKGQSTSSEAHDGKVYCVTVEDNHTVMAGRNGKFQWTGNTLYGVLSWSNFRLYDQDVASAVTATGRAVIQHTDAVVQSEGYEVLYGDTDSVLLKLSGVDVDPAIDVSAKVRENLDDRDEDELRQIQAILNTSDELEALINESYDEFAVAELNADDHWFDIEFEKLYERYFQAGRKKRYAGSIIWNEGKFVDYVDVTGFEFVRSDVSPHAQDAQKAVIDRIVDGADRNEIVGYVEDLLDEWENREVNIGDIGVPQGIGSPMNSYDIETETVRAAKYGNLILDTDFTEGSTPRRYYLDGVNPTLFERLEAEEGLDPVRDRMYARFKQNPELIAVDRAEQLVGELQLDWDKMRQKNLKSPLKRIMRSLDVDWEELLADSEQTGLHSYT